MADIQPVRHEFLRAERNEAPLHTYCTFVITVTAAPGLVAALMLWQCTCSFDNSGLAFVDARRRQPDSANAVALRDANLARDATAVDAASVDALVEPCSGYTYVNATSSYYVEIQTPATWADAKLDCESLHGHLVVIHSAVENANVRLFAAAPRFHIGLSDLDLNGVFAWVNGEALTYDAFNVSARQPSGEDCVYAIEDGSWFDLDCGPMYSYVCECEEVS